LLHQKNLRPTSWADWQKLDALEIARGKEKGKVRDKFDSLTSMFKALAD
jgi:adrenodoxin-NADP+ reductase